MRGVINRLRRHRELVLLLVSGLLLPVVTELISSWLEVTLGRTPTQLMQLIAVIAGLAIGLWVLYTALGSTDLVQLVPEEERPPCFPGLILLVGRGRGNVPVQDLFYFKAIEYHLNCEEAGGEPLRVCWLIASDGLEGSLPIAMALIDQCKKKYKDRCPKMIVRKLKSAFDVQEAYSIVFRIYTQEVKEEGLKPEQVIADFTGGTKPMAAGMVLACQDRWPMQYMVGKQGQIVTTPIYVRFTQSNP